MTSDSNWTVERHHGSERRPWLRVFSGPEAETRAVYLDEARKLTLGEVRLVDASGKVQALSSRS
jgi:hypothetical protein